MYDDLAHEGAAALSTWLRHVYRQTLTHQPVTQPGIRRITRIALGAKQGPGPIIIRCRNTVLARSKCRCCTRVRRRFGVTNRGDLCLCFEGFLGNVVDWLSKANRTTFLADEGPRLWLMGGFVLVVLPIIITLQSLVINQSMLGNIPQRIRWMTAVQERFILLLKKRSERLALTARPTVS